MRTKLLVGALMATTLGFSQSEITNFGATGRAGVSTAFATDYQALGINPGNLGLPDKYEDVKMALGFTESTYSVYISSMNKKQIKNSFSGANDSFTFAQKQEAARAFTNAPMALNVDAMWFGFGYQDDKIGGFAFSIRERINYYHTFNQTAAEILFMGAGADYFDQKFDANGNATNDPSMAASGFSSEPQNYSTLFNGTTIGLNWRREYNFGYGRMIIDSEDLKVSAGVGFKYIQGIAIAEISAENGVLNAYSAITPLAPIDYGSSTTSNPSYVTQTGSIPKPVGSGMGFDLGATVVLKEKLTLSASITDIGSMTWDGNVYSLNDEPLEDYNEDGMDSYNFFTEMGDFVADSSLFNWQGESSIETKLPTQLRLGGKMDITDKLSVGADVVVPMNDGVANTQSAAVLVGGDFQVVSSIRLSTGVTVGGNYGTIIPIGIVFGGETGKYEAGVSTRDLISLVSNDAPMMSLGLGFARMRF